MKILSLNMLRRIVPIFGIALLPILLGSCQQKPAGEPEGDMATEAEEVIAAPEVIWHIKALQPDGKTINIKALDAEGNIYDVKAIQNSDQHQLMDIKAMKGDQRLPVKILVSEDALMPVKAIGDDGTIYDIKALSSDGRLDVKGVKRSGNVIDIKAIGGDGELLGVKAISPDGLLNDVKGLKTTTETTETVISGVSVRAHVKAIAQANRPGEQEIWNVKAVHPDGYILDVKALDAEGNRYDVKAFQTEGQSQFMDVRAIINGNITPVKILAGEGEYLPVKAIGEDGTIFDIKALTGDGTRIDVKGVQRRGNIIDIKAIAGDGKLYGIKALSQEGMLEDIKGIKMGADPVEAIVNGVEVYAHVKALPQLD